MNVQRILFPTDFSPCANAALQVATSIAKDSGARLFIVHVKEPPVELLAGGGLGAGELGLDMESLRAQLRLIRPLDPSVAYEQQVVMGMPAAEIVRFANKQAIDLIVMGTHGRTGLVRALLGSVAEAVVRRAACPVLTLKDRPAQTAPELATVRALEV